MRVAVLGAAGQIGRALVERWLATPGVEPIAIVRNTVGAMQLGALAGLTVRTGDVTREPRLLEGCDAVVNAALASGLPHAARLANEALTDAVARAAAVADVRAYVLCSSVAVYGSCIHPSTGSTFERPRPTGSYGRDKLAAERQAARAFRGSRATLHVVRLGHVVGPYQANSRAFLELARSPRFALPFEGREPSNALHVDRLAQLLAVLLEPGRAGGTLDGVDAPNATWREVFAFHTEAAGAPAAALLDDATSEALRRAALAEERAPKLPRALGRVTRAALSAGLGTLATDLDVRDLGHRVLVALPPSFETAVKSTYLRWSVGRHVTTLPAPGSRLEIGPQMLSVASPGPALGALAPGAFDGSDARAAIGRWADGFRPPAWAG